MTDYSWIKVKKYTMDLTKDWEGRYQDLEKHHEAETAFLIAEVERLRGRVAQLEERCRDMAEVVGSGPTSTI